MALSNSFTSRLKASLYSHIPFFYPESKGRFSPDYDGEIFVEASLKKNYLNYKLALIELDEQFNLEEMEKTFNLLEDEYSKEVYIQVALYWFFKTSKIRLPLYYDTDFYDPNKFDYLFVDNTEIKVPNGVLNKYDLGPLNYNLRIIFGNKLAFKMIFVQEQYKYRNVNFVSPGDVVLDGGACYGDTALYFLDKIKGKGKVYSFEFMEKNLEIFYQNLELNPHYKDQIEIVKKPISGLSNQKLYVKYNASASFATSEKPLDLTNVTEIESITIDDFVKQNKLEKVDLIKLDIEGFEYESLKSAVQTIKKFQPKLAICIYHKLEDLWRIPNLLKEINPAYKFYINHTSLNTEETVLFAKVA